MGRNTDVALFLMSLVMCAFLTERLTEGTLTAQSAQHPKADAVCSRPSGLIIVMFYQCGILRSDNFINSKALLKDNV